MKLCAELVNAVTQHLAVDTLVLGAIGTAMANTIPDQFPRTLDGWWAWFRDFVRLIGNTRHTSLPKA